MSRSAIIAASAMALLVLPGCGSSGGPAAYVAAFSNEVDYIQWQQSSSGHLQGTMTVDQISGTAPTETLSANTTPFTGNVNDSSVSLTFGGLFGITANVVGSASGSTLTLQVPQSDGTIQSASFTQGNLTSFNTAVATLRRQIHADNARAAQAQAQAQQQQANARAEQTAQNDIATLRQDASLSSDSNLAGDLSNFLSDIQTAQSDLATEKQDASRDNSYCDATQTVAGDAQSVDGDLQSVQGDVQSLTPDIATTRQDITTVQNDLANLASSGLRAPSDATTAIASARADLKNAIAQANGYIDQINAIVAQAYSIANGMAKGSCSGDGPGSPTSPIPHLT